MSGYTSGDLICSVQVCPDVYSYLYACVYALTCMKKKKNIIYSIYIYIRQKNADQECDTLYIARGSLYVIHELIWFPTSSAGSI